MWYKLFFFSICASALWCRHIRCRFLAVIEQSENHLHLNGSRSKWLASLQYYCALIPLSVDKIARCRNNWSQKLMILRSTKYKVNSSIYLQIGTLSLDSRHSLFIGFSKKKIILLQNDKICMNHKWQSPHKYRSQYNSYTNHSKMKLLFLQIHQEECRNQWFLNLFYEIICQTTHTWIYSLSPSLSIYTFEKSKTDQNQNKHSQSEPLYDNKQSFNLIRLIDLKKMYYYINVSKGMWFTRWLRQS